MISRTWTTTGSRPKKAADACGVAYRTMLAKVRQGEVSAAKGGKDWRLRRTHVDAFIERSRVRPGELASAPPHIAPRRRADS